MSNTRSTRIHISLFSKVRCHSTLVNFSVLVSLFGTISSPCTFPLMTASISIKDKVKFKKGQLINTEWMYVLMY